MLNWSTGTPTSSWQFVASKYQSKRCCGHREKGDSFYIAMLEEAAVDSFIESTSSR